MAKHHFGKYAGVFQPCPTDPATVHPIRSSGREYDWPGGPFFMRNAGRFAGAATFADSCLEKRKSPPLLLDIKFAASVSRSSLKLMTQEPKMGVQ